MPKALLVRKQRNWRACLAERISVSLYPDGHVEETPFGRIGEPNWHKMTHMKRVDYAPGGAKVAVIAPQNVTLHLGATFSEDGHVDRILQKGLYYLPLMRVISAEARRRIARKRAAVDRARKALETEVERAWSEAKALQADCDVHQTFRGVEGVAFRVDEAANG